MRKNLKNVIGAVLIAFLAGPMAMAQTYTPEKENSADGTEVVLQGQNVNPELLANMGIFAGTNPRNATIEGNTVSLKQIGDYNIASIRTVTNASEINVEQNGNSNSTQLDYTANTAVADIVQNGDYNSVQDVVNSPDLDISIDLVQEGNDLKFRREGANELTKSIKFRQSEASPTLIIRSLN